MKLLISIILLLLPVLAHAVEGCKVVEFADRTEVVCEGDGKPVPVVAPSVTEGVQPQAQVPERSQDIETADAPAPLKKADPDQAAVPDTTQKNAVTVGPNPRSLRASPAERNAAAAERKRLILDQRPTAN
jgi:hypothetical protein